MTGAPAHAEHLARSMAMAEGDQGGPLEGYTQSKIHCAILQGDHKALRIILAGLPRPRLAAETVSEEQAEAAEVAAQVASRVLDRREGPGKESPLSLAVRLKDAEACRLLCAAGADISLQNGSGWTPLQDAVCLKQPELAGIILRHSQLQGWVRYQRRLPALAAVMGSMRDFYMELHWAFESPVVPFISRLAPSDTYRIWKRGPNLRADITLAGFDGFRLKRRRQSLLFFGQGTVVDRGAGHRRTFPPGSLLVLHHEKREAFDALEGAGEAMSDAELAADVAGLMSAGVYKAGVDVSSAWVQPLLNWRGAERTELVSGYKTTLYEMHDVAFKFRSRKVAADAAEGSGAGGQRSSSNSNLSSGGSGRRRAGPLGQGAGRQGDKGSGAADLLSSEEVEALEEALQSTDLEDRGGDPRPAAPAATSGSAVSGSTQGLAHAPESHQVLGPSSNSSSSRESGAHPSGAAGPTSSSPSPSDPAGVQDGISAEVESETRRALRPLLWVTQEFPLQLSELLPLLDLLANRVKAVQRLKDLLMLKLPPGTVPVKVAVPVVPTIRVQATFSKFIEYRGTPGVPGAAAQSGEGGDALLLPGPALEAAKAPLPRSRSRRRGAGALQGRGDAVGAGEGAHQWPEEAGPRFASPTAAADLGGAGLGVRNGPEWDRKGLGQDDQAGSAQLCDQGRRLDERAEPGAGAGGVAECPSGEEEFHTPPDSPGRSRDLAEAASPAAACTPHLLHSASSPALGSSRDSSSKGLSAGDAAPAPLTSSSSSWFAWARGSRSGKGQQRSPGQAPPSQGPAALDLAAPNGLADPGLKQEAASASEAEEAAALWAVDPFTVPMEYTWITLEVRRRREREKARKAAKQAQAQAQAQDQAQTQAQTQAQGK